MVWHSDFSFRSDQRPPACCSRSKFPPSKLRRPHLLRELLRGLRQSFCGSNRSRRIAGKTMKQGNIVDTAMKLSPGASPRRRYPADAGTEPSDRSQPIPETGCGCCFLGRRHGSWNGLMAVLWRNRKRCSKRIMGACDTSPVRVRASLGRPATWSSGTIVRRFIGATVLSGQPARPLRGAGGGHRPFEAPDALSRAAHSRFQLHR